MTPEEDLLSHAYQTLYPEQQETWSRFGKNLANTPGYVKSDIQNIVAGTANLLPGVNLPRADAMDDATYPLSPPAGAGQIAADVFGRIPSELAEYLAPAGIITKGARLLGLGSKAAPALGNIGAGALLGMRDNRPLGTAAEFGAMEGVNALANLAPNPIARTLLRTAGNAAIPSSSAALRGQDPFSEQALVQGSLQGVLGSGAPEALLKRLRSRPSSPVPPEVTPTDTPSPSGGELSDVLALEWPHGDARTFSPSGEPIVIDPTLGEQGQLRLPGPATDPSARPWSMIEWPYGGGQGIPLPEPPGVRPRMAAQEILNRPRQLLRRQTIDTPMEVKPLLRPSADPTPPAVTPSTAELTTSPGEPSAHAPVQIDAAHDIWGVRDPDGNVNGRMGQQDAISLAARRNSQPAVEGGETQIGTSNVSAPLEKNIRDFLMMNGGDHLKAAEMAEGYKLPDVAAELRLRADPLAVPTTSAPEIAGIEPVSAPLQEPSQGRIGRLLQNWKLETDPVKKQAMWRELKALENANPPGMKLGQRNESGAISTPLLAKTGATIAGGIAGYTTGDTEEDRLRNAAIGAGLGFLGAKGALGLNGAGKPLLKLATQGRTELARQVVEPAPGVETNVVHQAARALEQYHPNVSPEVFRALEKAKGRESYVRGMVSDASPDFLKIASSLTPVDTAIGDRFLASSAKPADITALDASTVPQPYKDFLKASKMAGIESQRTVLRGESNPGRRLVIAGSLGSYTTRQFRAILHPESWINDPVKEAKVIDQFMQSPEFKNDSRETVAQILRQHAAEMGTGGYQNLKPSDPRISGTLYKHKKDFAPSDWQFIDAFANEPHLKPEAQKFLRDMVASKTVDMGDQGVLRAMAGLKGTYHTDAARLRELADKEVLTEEYRDWLGEIKDPVTRQILTVNKLANSVKGAEAFTQLANTTFEDGRRMAYTREHFDAAKGAATPSQLEALKDYTPLPDNPSLGRLSGQYVPRDAADALNAMFDRKALPKAMSWVITANSAMKEMLTVANPSTQVRQFAQIPFFAAAARVYPHELPGLIADYARVMRSRGALRDELIQNHVVGANFAENDLVSLEKAFSGEGPGVFHKARKFARDLYRIPDDLVRGVAYLKHKDQFLAEAAGKGMTGDLANQYAVDKALNHLRDYTMNYSALPKTVNVLKHVPLFSPFISYSYEMARISKNLLRDVAKGDAVSKVHAAAALATLYALPVGLSIAAKNLLLSAKDKDDWEKIQSLLPAYQRFQFMAPVSRGKDGTFRTIGLNGWMPAGDLASIMSAAAKGDWESVANENPVIGLQKHPLAAAAMDISRGENYFTKEPIDNWSKRFGRAAEVLPSLTPGVGYLAKKLVRSFTPNNEGGLGLTDLRTGRQDTPTTGLLATVGATTQFVQPRTLLRRAQAETEDRRNKEKGELRRKLMSNRNDADKEEARRNFRSRIEAINRDYADKLGQMRSGN